MPKATPGTGSPSAHLAHGPAPRCSPTEALPAVERTPPRSRAPRRGPSRRNLRLARDSLSRALCEASVRGKLRLARDPPRRTMAAAQPPDGIGCIYLPTTPRQGAGVRWRQAASPTTPHSGRYRRPVRMFWSLCRSRHGAGLRRPVRTCLTPPCHCAAYPVYFSPLQGPRRAWATTFEHGTALDRGKTGVFSTLDALPHPTQGTAHPAVTNIPTPGATGHGHALDTVEGLARTTTTHDAKPHSTRNRSY